MTLASEIAQINLMEKNHRERPILYNASYLADMNDSDSGSDKEYVVIFETEIANL